MILKEELKDIVEQQKAEVIKLDQGIKRDLFDSIDLGLPHAIVLSGIRRCGKSTLLHQLIKGKDSFCYFNFEDLRAVDFELKDFAKLGEICHDNKYHFFDEIQVVEKWEIFVRSLLDKKKTIVITGSNASLLSKELGTKLTGRHINYELFPFSFQEFLRLKNLKPNLNSFEKYLVQGGFPEYLIHSEDKMLRELLNNIIARDIVVRHKLRDIKTIKEIALFLLTNISKEFSYNSLKKMFRLGSTTTVSSFVSYFEDSYLFFTLPRFSYSLKKQIINPKKVYSIDNALCVVNSLSFSSDKGRLLENLVYLALRRQHQELFYYKEENECDFLVREKGKITQAIQVCYKLDDDNRERELAGLKEAMKQLKLKKGLILTFDQEDEIESISILPVWKWLLT